MTLRRQEAAGPTYYHILGKYGQYVVNIDPSQKTNEVQVFKSTSAEQMKLVCVVTVPEEVVKSTTKVRDYVIKELRKAENFLIAKEKYESSTAKLSESICAGDLGELYIKTINSYQERRLNKKAKETK